MIHQHQALTCTCSAVGLFILSGTASVQLSLSLLAVHLWQCPMEGCGVCCCQPL